VRDGLAYSNFVDIANPHAITDRMYIQQIAKILQQAKLKSGKPQLIYHIWIWLSFPPQHALPLCSTTINQLWFPWFTACLLQDFCNLLYFTQPY